MSHPDPSLAVATQVETLIYTIRGQRVMLSHDLARLYDVATRRLNEAVKRNPKRFPPDFMFQLTQEEWAALRSHFATSKDRGGARYPPYAFTEHGAAMLASVLSSDRAIEASIIVVRAFIHLRRAVIGYADLLSRVEQLEALGVSHDEQLSAIIAALNELIRSPEEPERQFGFRSHDDER